MYVVGIFFENLLNNNQGDTSASSSPEIISKSSKSESGDNRLFFLFLITDDVSSICSWLSEMSAEAEKKIYIKNFVKINIFYMKT